MNIAAIIVLDKGSKKSTKNFQLLAPSSFAASRSSSGTDRKYCRKKNVAIADADKGKINPAYELVKFRSDTI